MKHIEISCSYCGEGVRKVFKRGGELFCSRSCSTTFFNLQRGRFLIKLICENCKEAFITNAKKRRFCSPSCSSSFNNKIYRKGFKHSKGTKIKLSAANSGEKNPMYGIKREKAPGWKGGEFLTNGYWFIYQPDHPTAVRRGVTHIKRCQLVLEKQLKRYLTEKEEVHHKNNITTDDDPENLEAKSKSKHQQIHALERIGYIKRNSLGRFMKGGDAHVNSAH